MIGLFGFLIFISVRDIKGGIKDASPIEQYDIAERVKAKLTYVEVMVSPGNPTNGKSGEAYGLKIQYEYKHNSKTKIDEQILYIYRLTELERKALKNINIGDSISIGLLRNSDASIILLNQ